MTRIHPVLKFLLAAIIAEFTGAFTILLTTFDFETIGLGTAVPVFLVPSAILYLFCQSREGWRSFSTLAYVIPFVGVLIFFLMGWLVGGEGAGMAYYMAWIYFVSGNVALITLWMLSEKDTSSTSRGRGSCRAIRD